MRKIIFISCWLLIGVSVFAQKQMNLNLTRYATNTYNTVTDFNSFVAATNLILDSIKVGSVNIKAFGAVGDGVTDDYTAFLTGVTFARNHNAELIIPTGTYVINHNVSLSGFSRTKNLKITGIGNPILDFSGITTGSGTGALLFYSDTLASINLNKAIHKGDSTISVTVTGIDVQRGDIIQIHSSAAWYGTAKKGELLKVRSIIGDTIINCYGSAVDNYTSATTRVQIFPAATAKIKGINIKYKYSLALTGAPRSLSLSYFKDVSIEDCEFYDNAFVNVHLQCVYNWNVDRITVYEANKLGAGYGVEASGSCYGNLSNSNIDGVRHAFTTDPSEKYLIPARFINVNHCYVSNTNQYNGAIDTHAESEYITFENNVIKNGGINIRDINFTAKNNMIFVPPVNSYKGIQITKSTNYSANDEFIILEGNHILVQDSTKTTYGIAYYSPISNSITKRIIIVNNDIQAIYSAFLINVSGTGNVWNELSMNDNRFYQFYGNLSSCVQLSQPNLTIRTIRMNNENYVTHSLTAALTIQCAVGEYLSIKNSSFVNNNDYALSVSNFNTLDFKNNYVENAANQNNAVYANTNNIVMSNVINRAKITLDGDTVYNYHNVVINNATKTLTNNGGVKYE